jgi:hypothetical protein
MEGSAPLERTLPTEILEHILEEVWTTMEPAVPVRWATRAFDMNLARYRWPFYAAATAAFRQLRAAALELPYRHVILRTTGDMQLYHLLVSRRLAAARRAGEDTDALHRTLFAHAHIRLAYAQDLSGLDNLAGPETPLRGTLNSPLVPVALTVVLDRWLATPALLDWLNALGTLEYLYIGDAVVSPSRGIRFAGAPRVAPIQQLLRRSLVVHTAAVRGLPHAWADVFSAIRVVITRLILLSPQSLRAAVAALPPTLGTLVLDARPGQDGTTSLGPWGIPAALTAGIFDVQRRRGLAVRIVVRVGQRVEPLGWDAALRACEKHGVTLDIERMF